jgi:hypothetical protein
MRLILLGFVLTFGSVIGLSAIGSITQMQDAKLARFCKSIPVGASYDEMCQDFR